MKLTYNVQNNSHYQSIKQILKQEFHISNRLITKLKDGEHIFLNGKPEYVTKTVNSNDILEIDLSFEEDNNNIIPTKMKLDILYEDDALLVVNKPPYLPVHPSMNHFEDSLSNGVKFYFDSIGLKLKIRPVNRLDKDTSGIVIFAKNEYIQEQLINQMQNHIFEKKYLALLEGTLEKNKTGTINAPIIRKENSIIERCISLNGQTSITHYTVLEQYYNMFCLVEFILETGRTHQIRVHSKYIGHPILGDSLYGNNSNLIKRQALHAYYVHFIHPITHEKLVFTSKLPNDIENLLY